MGCHVIFYRYATKLEVLELLKRSGYTMHVMVVAGGIWATPSLSSKVRGRRPLISRETVEKRHLKAKAFQSKVYMYNKKLLGSLALILPTPNPHSLFPFLQAPL